MFKFEEYPEIEKAHKIFKRLDSASYAADVKHENTNLEKHYAQWSQSFEKKISYKRNEYAKIVFDTFVHIKPKLYNILTKKYEKWNTIFGKNYTFVENRQDDIMSFLNDKEIIFVNIIEEEGRYRLPPEYYNEVDEFRLIAEQSWTKFYTKEVKKIAKKQEIVDLKQEEIDEFVKHMVAFRFRPESQQYDEPPNMNELLKFILQKTRTD